MREYEKRGSQKNMNGKMFLRMFMFFSCFSKHDETNDIRWQILTRNAPRCAVLSIWEKGHRKRLVKIKKTIDCMNDSLLVSFAVIKKPYLKLVNMHYSCFVEYEKCVLHVQRDPLTSNIVGLWCDVVNQFTLRPSGLKGHKPLPCNRPQLCTVRCFIFET